MAKTFKNLYVKVADFENLWQAYCKARRNKRYKEPAAWFAMNIERNMLELHKELVEKRWEPGEYHHFYIHEPKRRRISAAPFRDRIVHHAIVNVLEPLYEARFSPYSYACRKGKGTHAAIDKAHWGIRNRPYFMKGDIRKFYPSVDHSVLKGILFHKIADGDMQTLIARIIDSGAGVLDAESLTVWYAGDDLFSPVQRPRGIPIGNLTSQFFANVMLNELDQFVHSHVKPSLYLRYMDDFLLFDNDKEKLKTAKPAIGGFLKTLRLRLHENKSCVRTSRQGLKFLGLKLTPQTRRLCRDNISRFRRRMKRLGAMKKGGEVDMQRITASVEGWLAHAAHANTGAMLKEVLADVRI